jgi:undecaprenyl-diphosphatase
MRVWPLWLSALEANLLLRVASAEAPPWIDRLLRIATHGGGVAWTILLPLAFVPSSSSRRTALAALGANIGSHLVVQILKRTVVRPRPSVALHDLKASVALPDAYSFPSGHACAATAIAGVLLFAHSPLAPPFVLLALLVGASRVYLRVHYPSDVVAGHFIGAAGAFIVS